MTIATTRMSIKQTLFISIYRIAVAPVAVLVTILLGPLFVPKIREGLRLRRKKRQWPEFSKQPIWIHASSGEFEYAKPFIRELKARYPDQPVVVTYFSPTYAKAIESFDGVDFALPLPLDLPGPCRQFLNRVKPRAGFIARTDLWPELLTQASYKQIPVLLFSSTKTKVPSSLSRWFDRWMWSYLKTIFCVSEADAANIAAVASGTPTIAIGDTRFDQVIQRLKSPRALKTELKPERVKTLVAGSTWKEDESVLIEAVTDLLRNKKLNLVIAPHEPTPDHIESLLNEFNRRNIPAVRYSTATGFSDGVLVVDQMGILAELYQWGALAFVGGSFKASVHSVMEPLAAGAFTFVGPYHSNNREAIEFQNLRHEGRGLVRTAKDAASLQSAIATTLNVTTETAAAEIRREIEKRSGASQRLLENCRDLF